MGHVFLAVPGVQAWKSTPQLRGTPTPFPDAMRLDTQERVCLGLQSGGRCVCPSPTVVAADVGVHRFLTFPSLISPVFDLCLHTCSGSWSRPSAPTGQHLSGARSRSTALAGLGLPGCQLSSWESDKRAGQS